MPESNSIWGAARNYASKGIYVNPVYVKRKADGKKDVRPVGNWRANSTISLADIGTWEQDHPNAALLIDTGKSGLVIIDPDRAEGIAAWLALGQPATARARTPGGGEHWYYRAHPDHVVGNDQSGKVAPDVDVRGLGGFAFAPPSHDGTGAWEWIDGEPDWANLPYVPDLVIERMKARGSAPTAAPAGAVVDDSPFDDAPRLFTRKEATAFIKEAKAKLAGTRKGYNGAINNFAMACAHFPWLVDRELCATLVIRALGPTTGWTEPDHADRATINSAYSATEAGKSWVATEAPEGEGSGVGNPAATPLTLPGPEQTLEAARVIATAVPEPLIQWCDMFFAWNGESYTKITEADVKQQIYDVVAKAHYVGYEDTEGGGKKQVNKKWPATPKATSAVLHSLRYGIVGRDSRKQPDRCHALINGVLEISDDRSRELLEHDSGRFNLNSAKYAYDPSAKTPVWDRFLSEVLSDPDDRKTLQEFFGYCVSHDTSHQVMLSLSGKKRSGKGTIMRVLTALVGEANRAAGSLKRLTGEFGLAPLLGKTLLTFGDVRWNIDTAGEAVQLLLEISGEDAVQVNIKNKDQVSVRLGVRVVFAGNSVPRVSDPSGAFAERLLCLVFRESFAGREDRGLESKLMAELPGILNWALDGSDRLALSGRFTQSAGAAATKEAIEAAGQGSNEFVRFRLIEKEGERLAESDLMEAHRLWAEDEKGRKWDRTSADTLRPLILDEYPAAKYCSGKDRFSVRIDGKPRKVNGYLGLALEVASYATSEGEEPFD